MSMKDMAHLLLLFLTLPLLSRAQFSIVLPQSLKGNFTNRGIVNSTLGNFGHLAYGSNFLAKLFKPINNTDACRPFKLDDFKHIDQEDPYFGDENYVILVDRGDCTFVDKTLNIQKFGAVAAIIVDNVQENSDEVVMIDANNKGESLHIPAYLIKYSDGEMIKKVVEDEDDIMIRVSLEIGNDENDVEYDLWYANPSDFLHYDLSQVTKVYDKITPKADFEPRIYTYSCINCSEQMRSENCISDGKYCTFWPRIEFTYKINYQDLKLRIITEALTEKCLYNYLRDIGQAERWFEYMDTFIKDCVNPDTQLYLSMNSTCSKKVMASLSLPFEEMNECVLSSFVHKGNFNSDNTLLKADSLKKNQVGVNLRPQLVINKFIYRGQFDYQDILTAVCSAFRPRPDQCKDTKMSPEFEEEDFVQTTKFHTNDLPQKARLHHVLAAVVVVIIINLGLLLIFKHFYGKKRTIVIKDAVNSEVQKYMKITEGEEEAIAPIETNE